MSDATRDERSRAYLEAIRRRVCAACLDERDDGSCGLVLDANEEVRDRESGTAGVA